MDAREWERTLSSAIQICNHQHVSALAEALAALEARMDEVSGWMANGACPDWAAHASSVTKHIDEAAPAPAAERGDCDACAGSGDTLSGKPCICGGSGKAADAQTGLREELVKMEERAEKAEAALALASAANTQHLAERDALRAEVERLGGALVEIATIVTSGVAQSAPEAAHKLGESVLRRVLSARVPRHSPLIWFRHEWERVLWESDFRPTPPPPATGEVTKEAIEDALKRGAVHAQALHERLEKWARQPVSNLRLDSATPPQPSPGSPHITESGYLVHLTIGGGNVQPSPEKLPDPPEFTPEVLAEIHREAAIAGRACDEQTRAMESEPSTEKAQGERCATCHDTRAIVVTDTDSLGVKCSRGYPCPDCRENEERKS